MAKLTLLLLSVLVVAFVSSVQSGIVTNQSVSTSSSSSSSTVTNKDKDKKLMEMTRILNKDKKPSLSRQGKVLYTAPYSNVRVTKNEAKLPVMNQQVPRFRSIGPALMKQENVEVPPTQITSTSTYAPTSPKITTSTPSEEVVASVTDDDSTTTLVP